MNFRKLTYTKGAPLLTIGFCLITLFTDAQEKHKKEPVDSSKISRDALDHVPPGEKDIIDILGKIVKAPGLVKHDTLSHKTSGRIHLSAAPGLGYSLSTGFGAIIAANLAFYTSSDENAKLSSIFGDVVYTQNRQFIVHTQGNIWTSGNKFNIVTDWRYLKYPQRTYGLGGLTDESIYVDQDYQYLRLYQTVLRNLGHNFYAGLGYSLDYHWNISGTGDSTILASINDYGIASTSVSSGLNFNVLYDNRDNSINPDRGAYMSVLYRTNYTFMGSSQYWEGLRIDLRKYVRFPASSNNVLAFWSFNWLTLQGSPPYLDLPSTGWDPYNNTGRGYIQGRFRSKNMLYLETEYRFRVSGNGLVGGVVFANAETFSEMETNTFRKVWPGAGVGVRLKFNKHSRANVAIDYGWGADGSQGFFLNLGEIF